MSQRVTRTEQTEYHQQNGSLLDADELRTRSDERAPLAHRTDRIALRNKLEMPVVFVDDDPLFSLAPDAETARNDPLKTGISDIRHQHYAVEADDLDESERIIREIADQFDADTGRRFYFVLYLSYCLCEKDNKNSKSGWSQRWFQVLSIFTSHIARG